MGLIYLCRTSGDLPVFLWVQPGVFYLLPSGPFHVHGSTTYVKPLGLACLGVFKVCFDPSRVDGEKGRGRGKPDVGDFAGRFSILLAVQGCL